MRVIDFRYSITDERMIAYARVPLVERLRWLEELACFTQLWRSAPRAVPTAAGSKGASSDRNAAEGD